MITAAEHDVFGDGTVVIRQATGHTEGHSVLYVKLAKTGGVVLSGDLYHYPAERTLKRLPTFEVSEAETAAARAELEGFLDAHGRAALDPARPRRAPQAQEGARVLRLNAAGTLAVRPLALGRPREPAPEPLEALADAAGRGDRRDTGVVVDAVVAAQHAERADP